MPIRITCIGNKNQLLERSASQALRLSVSMMDKSLVSANFLYSSSVPSPHPSSRVTERYMEELLVPQSKVLKPLGLTWTCCYI